MAGYKHFWKLSESHSDGKICYPVQHIHKENTKKHYEEQFPSFLKRADSSGKMDDLNKCCVLPLLPHLN